MTAPNAPPALLELVQSLSHAITYTECANFDTNKKLWDNYARDWKKDADWVQKMVSNLPDVTVNMNASEYLKHLGDEWSDKKSLVEVLEDYFWPYINDQSVVAELGSGGGRVASKVASRVKHLTCMDISSEMLKKAKESVIESIGKEAENKVSFILLDRVSVPVTDLDFIYAFDVFPHVDLHSQWKYYQAFYNSLKPGAKALIHTANLEAPQGWDRFIQQKDYTAGGFYFMCPSMVLHLVEKAGFEVVKHSSPFERSDTHPSDETKSSSTASSNIYYNRDFLVLVSKQ